MILAGDIGGTNTRLALFPSAGRLAPAVIETYPSRDHAGLAEIVDGFLTSHRAHVRRAVFGIAGPVHNGRSKTTNLPWIVDSRRLARQFGLSRSILLNDLEAIAWGVPALGHRDVEVLQAGRRPALGNAAVIAAGTGLGEAGLYWDGRRHHPFACEGGHTDFAARNDLEKDLRRHLATRFGRVSYERVVSGPGLHNVYTFLRETGHEKEPPWLTEELRANDPGAVISRAALEGRDPLCSQALDLFVSVYGAEAGNLALKMLASGGVFVAGGIAPKILPRLKSGAFIQAFRDKGRMQPLMEAMPVRIVLNQHLPLLGAARRALTGPA